jgi:hypothetical protein
MKTKKVFYCSTISYFCFKKGVSTKTTSFLNDGTWNNAYEYADYLVKENEFTCEAGSYFSIIVQVVEQLTDGDFPEVTETIIRN